MNDPCFRENRFKTSLQLLQSSNWDELFHSYRMQEFDAVDEHGMTLLHKICIMREIPENIVGKIIEASPQALMQQDVKGETPLMKACFEACSDDIIRLLLHWNPEALLVQDNQGDTPLHISFQCGLADELILLFIWSNPHAVLMANAKGELPLHSACEQTGISRCIIEALIQYDHSQLYTKDENENTALMITWNKLLEHEKCRDDIPDSHPHELQNEARSFFDTLSILLMVSGMCMDGGDKTLMYDMQPYNILRSAIKCNKIYPLSLIKYLVKSYPSLMNIRDEAGQLPLHLSCQIHDINCPVIGENSDDDTANQSRVYIVSCMVEAFPNAARVNDCTGRYPIHYALSAGYKWNDGLKQIFFAAPELVSSRDKRTGLFPFMLAAADECQCIDSIFILLRREPDLIRAQRCETAEMYE